METTERWLFLLASLLVLAFIHQADTGVLTFDYRVLAQWGGLSESTERWLFLPSRMRRTRPVLSRYTRSLASPGR